MWPYLPKNLTLHGDITMRRVIVPALLAIALVATSSVNASAFGLFDKLCNSGCDTGCAVEPACGCEAPIDCGCAAEPTCGCEVAPSCGCEVAPTCGCEAPACGCDSGCSMPKMGLLKRLFGKRHCGCDSGCAEPACGCEIIEPTCAAPCGCAAEPTCGCEVAPTCGC